MTKPYVLYILVAVATVITTPGAAQSVDIKEDIASAYNEGLVRCGNEACAKYLYACFRSYSAATLNEFLVCGTQASRLNDNVMVVPEPG